MTQKNQAAGGDTAPAAFVLHDLKATDVWQMTRVLKRLDIAKMKEAIDPDLLKRASFKTPTMYDKDGNVVPLPAEKWTAGQKRAAQKAKEASDELTWQVLGLLMDNIGSCEQEVNKLLAMGCGCSVEDITGMDAAPYLDLIVQYITREGFADFFTHAAGLLKMTNASRASIVSVATSIK